MADDVRAWALIGLLAALGAARAGAAEGSSGPPWTPASSSDPADPLLPEFREFVRVFQKSYSADEWATRFEAFKANVQVVRGHDAQSHGFGLAVNAFADMSPEEFARGRVGLSPSLLGARAGDSLPAQALLASSRFGPTEVAEEVDWVRKGVLPPVSDQGKCGGCWAFSATAALTASWKIATGQLVVLSEQQLMDCSVPWGNTGCAGGNMDVAFSYAKGATLCAADTYPYVGNIGSCRARCAAAIPKGGVVGARAVPAYSEQDLLEAVALQPVAVGIEAERTPAFQLYSHGVLSGACEGAKPNHAVLVVGYGKLDGKDYWLVRNSWGRGWGEEGYFKLARGPGLTGSGECGILTMPSYPVVDAAAGRSTPVPPAAPGARPWAPEAAAPHRPLHDAGQPCARGTTLAAATSASGAAGEVCAPECTDGLQCPSPGQCVLRERSFLGLLFGRRFCAVVCVDDSPCPAGARCMRPIDQPGICVYPREGAVDRKLSERGPGDLLI